MVKWELQPVQLEKSVFQWRKDSCCPLHLCSLLHVLLLPLCGAPVLLPVMDLSVFVHQQQPQPLSVHLHSSHWSALHGASLLCPLQSTLLGTRIISIWPQGISIPLCFISHMFQPFVCSVVEWSITGGRHSRASFNLQYWVCKHSGQTLHASSFCSEYLSARVKQLSKRETLAPGRSSYDPKYPSSHRTEANAVLEMRDKQAPYHCGRKFICDCCSKIPTHFLVLPWSFLQHLSSTSTSW